VKWPGPECRRQRDDHIGLIEIVHRNREQVLNSVSAPARLMLATSKPFSVGRLEGIHDILGTGIRHVSREDVL